MKNKLLVLLMATTMAISSLTGCVNSNSPTTNNSEISVSEMLEHVLKENNGSVYIYKTSTDSRARDEKRTVGKGLEVTPYLYTSDSLIPCDRIAMGEIANGAEPSEEANATTLSVGDYAVSTDSSGNNVTMEVLTDTQEEVALYFGSFNRTTIYDKTFMVFTALDNATLGHYQYVLIEDTDFTKNKTVVYDSLSKEGLIIDSDNIDFHDYD